MITISNILQDINRGILAHNMIETCFSYRIIFYINENGKGMKHYVDTAYSSLRESLENIIRNHLSLTNNVVIANTTVLKDGRCVRLQSQSYAFSLDEYFKRINGEYGDNGRCGSIVYGRYAAR